MIKVYAFIFSILIILFSVSIDTQAEPVLPDLDVNVEIFDVDIGTEDALDNTFIIAESSNNRQISYETISAINYIIKETTKEIIPRCRSSDDYMISN